MFKVNKLFRWLSIRSKLIIAFAGLSVLPIIILSGYGIISTATSMRKNAIQNLDHDLTLIQENTANLLTDIGQDLQLIQNSFITSQFKNVIDRKNSASKVNIFNHTNNDLLSFANTKKIYYQIKILDNSGTEVLRIESQFPDSSEQIYKKISQFHLNHTPELFYLLIAKNLKKGDITIAPVELRIKSNELLPVMSFVMPIYNEDRKVGILIADVYVRNLFKSLQTYKTLNPNEKVILVSGDGYYLYHSDKKKDWNKLLAAKNEVNLKNDFKNVANKILSDKRTTIINGSNDIIAHTPLFYNYSSTYHVNIGYNFAISLYLLVTVSKSIIQQTIHKYVITFAGVIILFLLISIGLSLLATRHFTKSLSTLSKGAETISNGDYNYRVKVDTRDEIELLADQFNIMAKSLSDHEAEIQQYKAHLEEMVDSRTEELSNEKSKLQAILDNVPSAFLLLDKDLNIKTASKAITEITGYSSDKLIGENCSSIFGENGFCEQCTCNYAASTNKIQVCVNHKKDENNRERYIEHIAIPMIKNGKLVSILSVITDITRRKQLENFLIKTEKLAATGEIASFVAHEFRNSLTSIKMILQLLAESGHLSSPEKKSLEVALKSSGEMENIVSKLLNYANPVALNFQESDLEKIIDESIAIVRLNLRKSKIKIKKEVEKEIPRLLLDSAHLKEAIINIFFNSIHSIQEKMNNSNESNKKFTNEIIISINKVFLKSTLRDYKLESVANYANSENISHSNYEIEIIKGTECIVLQITDTGTGIEEKDLKRIFEPFFTTKLYGTGLGLPMVKRTINSHGGIITVQSEKWIGTKFNIYFPLRVEQSKLPKYI